jgi:hypothetical protein
MLYHFIIFFQRKIKIYDFGGLNRSPLSGIIAISQARLRAEFFYSVTSIHHRSGGIHS